MKKFLMSVILCGVWAAGFTSCSKDDVPEAPQIQAIENVEESLTLAVGQSLAFTATVVPAEETRYQWTVNGREVSTALSYTFQAEQGGEYVLKFTATNVSGTDSREFTVNVVLYKGGFFVINEGWFGHEMGSVDYFADANTRTEAVYSAANPGKELGNTTEFTYYNQEPVY